MFKVISFIVVVFGYGIFYLKNLQIDENVSLLNLPHKEVTERGNLLDSNGALIDAGWSKTPLKQFNSDQLAFLTKKFRLKKWDYYQVITSDIFFGVALADLGYAQNIQITFMEIQNQTFYHKDKILLPIIHPKLSLPDNIQDEFKYILEANDLRVSYTSQSNEQGKLLRILNINMTNLQAELILENTLQSDSIVVYTPINEQKTKFFYNQKSYNWLAKGFVAMNGINYNIMQAFSNAGSDWGRGIWEYKTFWLWASCMGFLATGEKFALNLGGGFADEKASLATEESIFINKKMYKLTNLIYDYDLEYIDQILVIKTEGLEKQIFADFIQGSKVKPFIGSFYCEFVPDYLNSKKNDFLLISTQFRQLFGYFTGAYMQIDGNALIFENIYGMIEFHHAKW